MDEDTATTKLRRGDARWFFGQLAIIRATRTDTDGAYSLLEVYAPAGLEAPLHVHHGEDEGFLVLEGEVALTVGDRHVTAREGDFLLGPRDVPHKFRVDRDARMLWVVTPAGFEDMVAAVSVPAAALTIPPPDVVPPADVADIVRRFGNELLE